MENHAFTEKLPTEEAASFDKLNITSWEKQDFPYGHGALQHALKTLVIPGLCIIGIVGNIINLVVLPRIHLYKTEAARDKGANIGLGALAISDTLFCISVFPIVFTDQAQVLFPNKSFLLYYQVYGTGLVTTFILISTWVTVALAVLRYFAICHPFSRMNLNSISSTIVIYTGVFICSILANIPTFFQYHITPIPYGEDGHLYLMDIGYMDNESDFSVVFKWLRFCVFILIPAIILLFSNFSLVHTLHRSQRIRQEHVHVSSTRVRAHLSRGQNRITLLLVVIALSFIVLVFPCELMDFFMDYIQMNHGRTEIFLLMRILANTLQMINFSCNFLMYIALNVHFRTAFKDLILCRRPVPHRFSPNQQSFERQGNLKTNVNYEAFEMSPQISKQTSSLISSITNKNLE